MRLAIITSHPIQYNAPLFQLLAARKKIEIKIFYTWSQAKEKVYDPGFGQERNWDIPILEGYNYEFIYNSAKRPGSHHFMGIKNPRLIAEIKKWQANAILVFGWSFHSHLSAIRYFKNKLPILFRGDSTLLNEQRGIKTMLRRQFLTWVYKHIDKALYVGQNNKEYFLKHGLRPDQLIAAPHAIDNERFGRWTEENEQARIILLKDLNLSQKDFVILYVGKIENVKNPFFLTRLAKEMPDDDIKFLIVGTGNLEQQLKEEINSDQRFRFLKFQNQSQMPVMYRLGKILILPSISETWGLVANEAMACGLPVMLSSKVGGALDLVFNNGIIFEPNDTAPVVMYINRLKNSLEEYLKAKGASIMHIKKFNYTILAESIESAVCNSTPCATS